MSRFSYFFSDFAELKQSIGNTKKVELILGEKGTNISELSEKELPISKGFVITTEVCQKYFQDETHVLSDEVWEDITNSIHKLEDESGKKLGDADQPLFVSLRSDSFPHIPGLLGPILNIGYTDEVIQTLSGVQVLKIEPEPEPEENPEENPEQGAPPPPSNPPPTLIPSDNVPFLFSNYLALIESLGVNIFSLPPESFDTAFQKFLREKKATTILDLQNDDFPILLDRFKEIYTPTVEGGFPEDPIEQIKKIILSIYESYNSQTASEYRQEKEISNDYSVSIIISTMIFGNSTDDSGIGHIITRNTQTGENQLLGEFVANTQGVGFFSKNKTEEQISSLEERSAALYQQFTDLSRKIERAYGDIQEFWFVLDKVEISIFKIKVPERDPAAVMKIACDLATEGIIPTEQAIIRTDPYRLTDYVVPEFQFPESEEADENPKTDRSAEFYIGKGKPAAPGLATGQFVFEFERLKELVNEGKPVIYLFEKFDAQNASIYSQTQGLIAYRELPYGKTSKFSKLLNIPAIVSVPGIKFETIEEENVVTIQGKTLNAGDPISISGFDGKIYSTDVSIVNPWQEDIFANLILWSEEVRKQPKARKSVNFGPKQGLLIYSQAGFPSQFHKLKNSNIEGIALCPTNRLYLNERLEIFQKFLLADTPKRKRIQLKHLRQHQTIEYTEIFENASPLPIVVQLLDLEFNDFFPEYSDLLGEINTLKAKRENELEIDENDLKLKEQILSLLEPTNPIAGIRGTRFYLQYPGVLKAQLGAILAGAQKAAEKGSKLDISIVAPLVSDPSEMEAIREVFDETKKEVFKGNDVDFELRIGAVIEAPRAAILASEIAASADVFIFKLSHLHHLAFGYTPDEAYDSKILSEPIFDAVDLDGVGELVKFAVESARAVNHGLLVGIVGDQVSDPNSTKLAHKIGANFVSVSTLRVPLVRFSEAQAILSEKFDKTSVK